MIESLSNFLQKELDTLLEIRYDVHPFYFWSLPPTAGGGTIV